MHNPEQSGEFEVNLEVFSGPFSVLLDLIAKRSLDLTEVALGEVTDEFIAFIRAQKEFDLSAASEFLVVATTLLAMKVTRLLPRSEDEAEDLEFLEQRDLLFAKLLQYKAYKEVAESFGARLARGAGAVPRNVAPEPEYADALPPVRITLTVEELAMLAVQAYTRSHTEPVVEITHLHDPVVPVSTQVEYIETQVAGGADVTFAQLCADAPNGQTVVSRFLAVLELIRRRAIAVHQDAPLAPLHIRATPAEDTGAPLTGEFDDAAAAESARPEGAEEEENCG
ncbi:segregation and condensation protein A [Actinobaculum suis]|uniref:Segregation and condensation protein A n=1 Tax=Actinobaculum suis TaxID=1657 RepID=A0A7Z8Y931_9ACTO|nr:ScpA family protein [Actinobaculum suis]VDG76482.1 segregation and condensation protein A [Actinobaculum suis]